MAGTVEADEGKSRRDVLRALGAAAAGVVAGGVLKADEAEASHGVINATSNSERPAIHAENTGGGPAAVLAQSGPGPGPTLVIDGGEFDGVRVNGLGRGIQLFTMETAVWAESTDHAAVAAFSGDTTAITADGAFAGMSALGDEFGVIGRSRDRFGPTGAGVEGSALSGRGVRGISGTGVGVQAVAGSDAATALQVEGKAMFSTAGSGTIAAGEDSVVLTNPAVTGVSHITVTLTGDPGQASSAPGSKPVVVWVERQPGAGFVVHLSRPVRFATPFTYLIVEPV